MDELGINGHLSAVAITIAIYRRLSCVLDLSYVYPGHLPGTSPVASGVPLP